jgi:hypothetical protein
MIQGEYLMAILTASVAVLSLSNLILVTIRLVMPVYKEKDNKLPIFRLGQADYDVLYDGMLIGTVFGIVTMIFSLVSMLTREPVLPIGSAVFFTLQLLSVFLPIIWVLMPPKFLKNKG